jgi:plasmid stabilization system protein ParE
MMLRYHEAAEEELLNEIGYLELQAQGLGRRFFAEIRRAEDRIVQFPQSAQEIHPAFGRPSLARMIHDSSSRNHGAASRERRAEP